MIISQNGWIPTIPSYYRLFCHIIYSYHFLYFFFFHPILLSSPSTTIHLKIGWAFIRYFQIKWYTCFESECVKHRMLNTSMSLYQFPLATVAFSLSNKITKTYLLICLYVSQIVERMRQDPNNRVYLSSKN